MTRFNAALRDSLEAAGLTVWVVDEVVDRALHDGPQVVTRHGENAVVIVAYRDFVAAEPAQDFKDFLMSIPHVGLIHECHHASAENPTVSVVEAVDRRVVLIVAAQCRKPKHRRIGNRRVLVEAATQEIVGPDQQVLDVVCVRPGHDADVGEDLRTELEVLPLRLLLPGLSLAATQLFLHPAPAGEILENDDVAAMVPLGIGHRQRNRPLAHIDRDDDRRRRDWGSMHTPAKCSGNRSVTRLIRSLQALAQAWLTASSPRWWAMAEARGENSVRSAPRSASSLSWWSATLARSSSSEIAG